MDIIVLLKQVPDLVEELEVNEDGTGLDRSWLRLILSESDDHALEQALLLKEQHGGQVKVLSLDLGEVEDTLYSALAKGADSAARSQDDFEEGIDSHAAARIYQALVGDQPCDLILTGVQAIDDLDGQVGAILASYLGVPYVGVVSDVQIDEDARCAIVKKEYPGGMLAQIRAPLPAVLGIQAATQPPRYVPVARIRNAMKTAQIEDIEAPEVERTGPPGLNVRRMYKPEVGERAEMISGSADEVADRIIEILSEKGLGR